MQKGNVIPMVSFQNPKWEILVHIIVYVSLKPQMSILIKQEV